MRNDKHASVKYRALLTDTLPYEVPVIFSNDKFHLGLCAPMSADVEKAYLKVVKPSTAFTIPYSYTISKDSSRTTTLSIVHPLAQMAVAEFYTIHANSLLNYCANSRFSLRRPTDVASPYGAVVTAEADEGLKLGLVEALREDGQPDVGHLSSFFVYGKYNLLGKFMDSREFIRLESKFRFHRSADVSKCFYNIYTHSLSWSVKDKSFAKDNRNYYSFENEFDKLMQICNYNETNGIVVGPEFSRIFAEIILQDVDSRVETELKQDKIFAGTDYDLRRYVDDYAIFANDKFILSKVEAAVKKHLESYKLFINERKVVDSERPFVSAITLARNELGPILRSIQGRLSDIEKTSEVAPDTVRFIRSQSKSIRIIVAKHEISFSNVSGWIMSVIRRAILHAVKLIENPDFVENQTALCDVVAMLLDVAFYICAMDARVRTTYSICQIVLSVSSTFDKMPEEQADTIRHVMMEEITSIVRTLRSKLGDHLGSVDNIEIFNLLICGSYFVGEEFLNSKHVQDTLKSIIRAPNLSYFSYITAKFCYLRNDTLFHDEIKQLEQEVKERILARPDAVFSESQSFLMFCDYISDKKIDIKERMVLFKLCAPGELSKSCFEDVSDRLGFVDWSGISVKHLLRRKELRPVYAWR